MIQAECASVLSFSGEMSSCSLITVTVPLTGE